MGQTFEVSKTDEVLGLDNPWHVILFNDEVHSFDAVVLQVQKATGYSLERATQVTLHAHQNGRSVVYIGSQERSEKIAHILGNIALRTSVERT